MVAEVSNIAPLPGEIQSEHYQRVFPLLAGTTEERNAAILDAWDQSEQARELDDIAAKRLPVDRFERAGRIPVFEEHRAPRVKRGADGKPVIGADGQPEIEFKVWDLPALEAMAYQMNHRIRDTGSFSPITDGHTPTREEKAKGAPVPAVLGYQGKFRVGKIGNVDPRWAIFCDEYHAVESKPRLQSLHRRSPEVWANAAKPFYDPCAALGAETPRLDMGTTVPYSNQGFWIAAGDDGADVERYSMAGGVAAFPGSTNVEPPKTDAMNYGAMGEPDGDEDGDMVETIINAIMETLGPKLEVLDQVATLLPGLQKTALKSELPPPASDQPAPDAPAVPQAGPAPGAAGDDGQQATPSPAAPPAAPPASAPQSPPQQDLDDADKNMMAKYMAGGCSEVDMRAHRDGKRKAAAPSHVAAPVAQYQRENEELRAELNKIRAEQDRRERYSRLDGLRQQGYSFDLNEEIELTADFDAAAFDRHCTRTVTKYQRLPVGSSTLPVMEGDPSPQRDEGVGSLEIDSPEFNEVQRYAAEHQMPFGAAYRAYRQSKAASGSPVK